MADTTNAEQTKENLKQVEDLLADIKGDARKFQEAGNAYMLSVYEEILSVISPIVMKASYRLEREELASIRKSLKEHRKNARGNGHAS